MNNHAEHDSQPERTAARKTRKDKENKKIKERQ